MDFVLLRILRFVAAKFFKPYILLITYFIKLYLKLMTKSAIQNMDLWYQQLFFNPIFQQFGRWWEQYCRFYLDGTSKQPQASHPSTQAQDRVGHATNAQGTSTPGPTSYLFLAVVEPIQSQWRRRSQLRNSRSFVRFESAKRGRKWDRDGDFRVQKW